MTTETKEKTMPVFKFNLRPFQGAVWKFKGDNGDYYRLSIQNSFFNKKKNGYVNTDFCSSEEVTIRRMVEDNLLKYMAENPLS